jgi:hypothetical protein
MLGKQKLIRTVAVIAMLVMVITTAVSFGLAGVVSAGG